MDNHRELKKQTVVIFNSIWRDQGGFLEERVVFE